MRVRGSVSVVVATIVVLSSSVCFAYSDEGFQWWTSASASTKISDDWKCTFLQEFRLGDDGGNFYYEHSDLGFTYSGLADWIDLGANFRLIYEKDGNDDWKRENRPHLNVTLKNKLFGLSVSSRGRFEYRDRYKDEDVWRYRHKVTVKFPCELTALKLKPYVADEIFATMNDDNVDKNRVYAGASFGLTETVSADIFYMWQTSRSSSGEWSDIHVLGTGLKLRF